MPSRTRSLKSALAVVLASITILLSPGWGAFEAVAQVVEVNAAAGLRGGAVGAPVGVQPVGTLSLGTLGGVGLSLGSTLSLNPGARVQLTRGAAPLSSGASLAPLSAASRLAGPAAAQAPVAGVPQDAAAAGLGIFRWGRGKQDRADAPAAQGRRSVAELGRGIEGDLKAAADASAPAAKSAWSVTRMFAFLTGHQTGALPALTREPAAIQDDGKGQKGAGADGALRPASETQAASAKDVPVPAAASSSKGDKPAKTSPYTKEEIEKAEWGMMLERLFGLASLSIGMVAYPLFVITAVGAPSFVTLMAIGSVIGVPLALLAGKVGDMMPLKKYTLFNIDLRAAISVAQAVFYAMDWLSFGSLLFLTILSSWQFATLFSNSSALSGEITGGDKDKVRATESKIRMATIFTTIGVSLFISAPLVGALGFFWVFMLTAAIQFMSHPALQWALPNHGRMTRSKVPTWAEAKAAVRAWFAGIGAGLRRITGRETSEQTPEASAAMKKNIWMAAIAAIGTALFFVPIPFAPWFYHTPLVLVVMAGAMVLFMKGFQTIKSKKLLLVSTGLVMIGAFIEVPLRNSALGVMASEVVQGTQAAAALLGSLVGAFYLGQLPSGTGMLNDKQTVFKKWFKGQGVNFRNMMKWIGAAVVAGWFVSFLFSPSSIAAAVTAGAAAVASAPVWGVVVASIVLAIPFFMHVEKSVNGERKYTWRRHAVVSALLLMPAAGAVVFWSGLIAAASPLVVMIGSTAAVVAGVMAGYFVLHNLSPKLNDSQWIGVEIAALLTAGLPLLFWPAMWPFLAWLAFFGFALNGSQRMIGATFTSEAKKAAPDAFQYVNGVKQALVSVTFAVAYAIQQLAAKVPAAFPDLFGSKASFPFTWYVIAGFYAVFAGVFFMTRSTFAPAKPAAAPAQQEAPKK